MHINKRLESILDKESYKRFDLDIDTTNPLNLEDYPKKNKRIKRKDRYTRSSRMWCSEK